MSKNHGKWKVLEGLDSSVLFKIIKTILFSFCEEAFTNHRTGEDAEEFRR